MKETVMKKMIALMIVVICLVGCERKPTEGKKERMKIKTDFITQGMNDLSEGDISKAIQNFDEAIKQDLNNAKNYVVLGQVYLRLKNYARAVDTFSAAVKVDQNNGELYYLLAISKGLNEDREGAIEEAQRSVELFLAQQNEEKLIQALALLKGLMEAEQLDMPEVEQL